MEKRINMATWLFLVVLILLLLLWYELQLKTPRCLASTRSFDWSNIYRCIDYNHNPVHFARCAIISILLTLIILAYLRCVSLRNFIIVFLILFVAAYFSANWLSAHFNRNVDYRLEPYVEKLESRIRKNRFPG